MTSPQRSNAENSNGEATVPPAPPHKPKVIDPGAVTFNALGFVWREALVRLPKEIGFGDLNEPRIWRQVQASTAPLKVLDRVAIVDSDQSWLVSSIVTGATERGLTLSKSQKIDLDPRTERLFETELYRIELAAGGYRVIRKKDNEPVTETVASGALAERDLRNLYPRSVA